VEDCIETYAEFDKKKRDAKVRLIYIALQKNANLTRRLVSKELLVSQLVMMESKDLQSEQKKAEAEAQQKH